MNSLLVFLVLIHYLLLFSICIIDRHLYGRDVFSPGRVFAYFGIIYSASLAWFAFDVSLIEELIFTKVSTDYQNINLVERVYLYSAVLLVVSYLGITFGAKVRHSLFIKLMNVLFSFGKLNRDDASLKFSSRATVASGVIFFTGIVLYLYFIGHMGGLGNLWANLNERTERAAGLGYLQQLYTFCVVVGSTILFNLFVKSRRRFLAAIVVLITIFILGSLGQRGPVVAYIFSLFVVYNYKIKRFRHLVTIKNISLGLGLLVFMLSAVQFRVSGALERYQNDPMMLLTDSRDTFGRHIIQRFGRVERDIVILEYFDRHPFWMGASYYSLVTAPIPRTYYPDKPPVDTGRYLLAMSQGEIIQPPVSIANLPSSSWPDGNWAGYMNFGVLGLVVTFFLSGALLGAFYQYVRSSNFSIVAVILYGNFSWAGSVSLSPMGIVNLLMFFALLLSLSIALRLFLPFKNRLHSPSDQKGF